MFWINRFNPFSQADTNQYLCKQCRSRLECSQQPVSSGSALFVILFFISPKPLFASVYKSKFKTGRVHFRNSGMKGVKQVYLHLQLYLKFYLQAHGGAGLHTDLPLSGFYGHARTLRLADGPDEVHRRTIARKEYKGHMTQTSKL